MKPRKIPLRRCSGCGESRPKRELVRVVRAQDGAVSLDLTGKKPGRGAYVCPRAACLAKARKAKRIERALEVSIPQALYDAMTAEIARAEAQAAGEDPPAPQAAGAKQNKAEKAEAQPAGAEKPGAEPAGAKRGETYAG